MVFLTAVAKLKSGKLATRSTILSFLVVVSAVFHIASVQRFAPSTVEYALRESTCFNRLVRAGTRVFCISSFPIEVMRLTTHNILTKGGALPLIVYQDETTKEIPGVACNIELTKVVPWLENTIQHPNSSLNKFLAFAGAYEPFSRPMQFKANHLLFRKVVSIFYTLEKAPHDSLIIWLDSDVTREARPSESVISWLLTRDVSYIPFYHKHMQAEEWRNTSWMRGLAHDWRLETGIFAVRRRPITRLFFQRILELYLGDLEALARICVERNPLADECKCSLPAVKGNLYMNDIFVISLVVHASLMDNFCVLKHGELAKLSHGWFGVDWKCPSDASPEKAVFKRYPHPNFCPPSGTAPLALSFTEAPHADIQVANFNILHYFMHHMGTTGALRLRIRNATTRSSWMAMPEEYKNYSTSLMKKLDYDGEQG